MTLLQVFERLGPYLASLERLMKLRPARLYPGHGPDITDAVERIAEYLRHRAMRERQIVEVCASPWPVSWPRGRGAHWRACARAQALATAAAPISPTAIVAAVYPGALAPAFPRLRARSLRPHPAALPPAVVQGAVGNVTHHLEKLVDEDVVQRTANGLYDLVRRGSNM